VFEELTVMPVHIDRVETEMDVLPAAAAGPGGGPPLPGGADAALKERLRPIVLEILQEELDRLRRKQG
jgi:hypothetical protein